MWTLRLGGILEETAAIKTSWFTDLSVFFFPLFVSFSFCPLKSCSFMWELKRRETKEVKKKKKENADDLSSIRLAWTSFIYTVIMKIFNVELFSKHTEHLGVKNRNIKRHTNQYEKGRNWKKRKGIISYFYFVLTIVKIFDSIQNILIHPSRCISGWNQSATKCQEIKLNKIFKHIKRESVKTKWKEAPEQQQQQQKYY